MRPVAGSQLVTARSPFEWIINVYTFRHNGAYDLYHYIYGDLFLAVFIKVNNTTIGTAMIRINWTIKRTEYAADFRY